MEYMAVLCGIIMVTANPYFSFLLILFVVVEKIGTQLKNIDFLSTYAGRKIERDQEKGKTSANYNNSNHFFFTSTPFILP